MVQSAWIRAQAFLLCPCLTHPKQFTWASHDPGDTMSSHSTPGLDGWVYTWAWEQVHVINMSPSGSGGWSILLIPGSNRPASPSCPLHDPSLIWRRHSSWRSQIVHVVSCCVIHDEGLSCFDEWGRVSWSSNPRNKFVGPPLSFYLGFAQSPPGFLRQEWAACPWKELSFFLKVFPLILG